MARVSINRNDKLPDVCVRCGQPRHVSVRIRFGKREGVDVRDAVGLPNSMFPVSRTIRHLGAIVPTIGWTLPFCQYHSWTSKVKHSSQYFLILAALIALALGGWVFATGHQNWPFVAAIVGAIVMIFAAHHIELRPSKVTRHRLELNAVDEHFAEEFERLNQLPEEESEDSNPFINYKSGG